MTQQAINDAAPATITGATGGLTDGTGVSRLLASKVFKDIAMDALLSIPTSLVAINVLDLHAAIAAPIAFAFAVGDSLIRVVYRAALRYLGSQQ